MSKKEKQKLDENGNKVKRKRLPGWAIALIVFAVIVAIVGCTLLGVFWDIWFITVVLLSDSPEVLHDDPQF